MSGERIAVFTKNRVNPAYAAARMGAARVARRHIAETIDFVPATPDDAAEQAQLIGEALAQRPDALVIAAIHSPRVGDALRRVEAAGIPLFGFVSPVPAGRCVTFVGSDDGALGAEVATHLYRHLRGRGAVLFISGPGDSVTSVARIQAFETAARAFPGIRIAGTCMGGYARDKARAEVTSWVAREPALDGCLAANDVMALGALEALRAAGHKAAVSGVNALPEAVRAIRDGAMLASADFDAMGMAALATECAIRHLRGERVPEQIELPVQVVDRSNCERWDLPFEQRPLPILEVP